MKKLRTYYVGFKVPMAVVTKNSVFWDVMACSLLKANRHFRGTCLHLQGKQINQARNQCEAGSKHDILNLRNTSYLTVQNLLSFNFLPIFVILPFVFCWCKKLCLIINEEHGLRTLRFSWH
jgi:hypothetical protein